MDDHYKQIVVTKLGGPEDMQIDERVLRPPGPSEVRVRTLAAAVSLPDIEARYGRSPFPPKPPFVPGYAIVGQIEAVGQAVKAARVGALVGALTVYGGYSQVVYLRPKDLIPVPEGVDPIRTVPLILNYLVAYQCLHRLAKSRPGDPVLIVGASGGIGTAFLQLGQAARLRMYGMASELKHYILEQYGAFPIDYHTQDFVKIVGGIEPDGLAAVFDGVGGETIERGFSLLRKGGTYVCYANPYKMGRMLKMLGQVLLYNLLPNGRSAAYYGTGSSRLNRQPFLEDWAALFSMLQAGTIQPIIANTFPLLEARQANAVLETGQVVGNLVLVNE